MIYKHWEITVTLSAEGWEFAVLAPGPHESLLNGPDLYKTQAQAVERAWEFIDRAIRRGVEHCLLEMLLDCNAITDDEYALALNSGR